MPESVLSKYCRAGKLESHMQKRLQKYDNAQCNLAENPMCTWTEYFMKW